MSIMLYSVLSTELLIKTLEYKFGEKMSMRQAKQSLQMHTIQ